MSRCKHSAQSWYIDTATGRRGCYDCGDGKPPVSPKVKHAAIAGFLAAGAAGLGVIGLWPVSCILCVEIGVQWVRAWGWQAPEEVS